VLLPQFADAVARTRGAFEFLMVNGAAQLLFQLLKLSDESGCFAVPES
jgi:hypothetical protein